MVSSRVMMFVAVLVMCSSSASCAMSVLGPMGGIGGGVKSAAKGLGKATGGTSKIKRVGGGNFGQIFAKLCNTCKSQNWQGKINNGKTDCSKVRGGCAQKGF